MTFAASNYDSWGNVTSRTYSSTMATLTYDLLDHFVNWNAGSEWITITCSNNGTQL